MCRADKKEKGGAEGPDEKELKKKEKQRLEKEKKEQKERQEREKKEQKEREKKESEMKKKFKVSGTSLLFGGGRSYERLARSRRRVGKAQTCPDSFLAGAQPANMCRGNLCKHPPFVCDNIFLHSE